MKKFVVLLLTLVFLIGCSKNEPPVVETPEPPKPQEPTPQEPKVEFTYQITQEISYVENETFDFKSAIIGNYDSIDIDEPETKAGSYLLRAVLHKDNQTKTIGIPYTITPYVPSSDYYLSDLRVENFELTPAFTWDNDQYEISIPQETESFFVSAQLQDPRSTLEGGTGTIQNQGVDFKHRVYVKSEDGQVWAYVILVKQIIKPQEPVVTNPPVNNPPATNDGIEKYNGLNLQYPDSQLATIRNDYLSVVNKQYRLESSFVPYDLVNIDSALTVYGGASIVSHVHDKYLEMRNAAAQSGLNLTVSNCYRSYARQKELYTHYLGSNSQSVVDTFSARPGHSEHQLGLACDFAAGKNDLGKFTGTAEQIWMTENAQDYGFILRYPSGKESITGYQYESWHYRYVGELAPEIKASGLTLDEYMK